MSAYSIFSQAKDDAETTAQEWLVEAHKAAKEAAAAIRIGDLAMSERYMEWLEHCEKQAEIAGGRARWYAGHASMYAKETVQ